jgi:hypothetical protein
MSMNEPHMDCGCIACRIAITDGINEIVQLTPKQYVHILGEGGLESNI